MKRSQSNDYSCPVCGARNLQVTTFSPPILFSDLKPDGDLTYVAGTYYCTVCSKDGVITTKKRASNGNKT